MNMAKCKPHNNTLQTLRIICTHIEQPLHKVIDVQRAVNRLANSDLIERVQHLLLQHFYKGATMRRLTYLSTLLITALIFAGCAVAQPAAPAAEAPAQPATEAPTEAPAEAPAETPEEPAMADIVDTAVAAGNFTTLVAAVEAAGLVDALKGEGPFTVFAPTDEAFAALPAGTVEALLADPSGDLTQILLYHVVPGQVMAADVSDGLEAETLQGGMVRFSVANGAVMINDANIVATDIVASNGVIHVIDAVILPPAE
jgi:uncharacterized surface protein with fasciclin (FAS1) repeats